MGILEGIAIAVIAYVVLAIAVIVAASIYQQTHPRTYIEHFRVSPGTICPSDGCPVYIEYKIGNAYPGTRATLEVTHNGPHLRYIHQNSTLMEFNEDFNGMDHRLINLNERHGIYGLRLTLDGDLGADVPLMRTPPPPGPVEQNINLFVLKEGDNDHGVIARKNFYESADSHAVIFEPYAGQAEEYFNALQPGDVPGPVERRTAQQSHFLVPFVKTEGELDIFCKYAKLTAIQIRRMTIGDVREETARYVRQISDIFEAREAGTGFLAPQDDHTYSRHPERTDIVVSLEDGTEFEFRDLSRLDTVQMPADVPLDQGIKITLIRHSDAVPFFPGRELVWDLSLTITCV
jgi:hypothetical protein